MAAMVIGRAEELDAIRVFLADTESGPRALLLSGEAGIGKTVLWETGVDEARSRSGSVLTCRGVEAEASLSFAALSELVVPFFEEVAPSLPPPRRHALEVALLLSEPGDAAPDPHAIGLAVLDVLAALAERGSVLVALDDVQWLDPASAGVLQIALRRLRREPVGLLATVRTGPEVEISSELRRSLPEERIRQLNIGPLSVGAVHSLLEERVGLVLTRPELVRVQEATAGNPFFALELGRELERTGLRPAPGQPLAVPRSLRELLGSRLARLPAETVDVLLQAAALAQPTVDLVAATYGTRERVLEAIEIAVREGVVELDGARLDFSHPLLASICYEQAPLWKRQAVHRTLASAVTDVEERARHLALAAEGADEVIASELDAAAEHAVARGAPAAGAELCELAAELTAGDPVAHRRRRMRAADLHRLAGDGERAAAMFEQLLTEVSPGAERADIILGILFTEVPDTRAMIELCGAALAEVPADDARAARILSLRSGALLRTGEGADAVLADAREAFRRAERAGDSALAVTTIARLGIAEAWAGETTSGLLARGVEIERRLGLQHTYFDSARYSLSRQLVQSGDTAGARAVLEELEREAAARGDEASRTQFISWLSVVEWLDGRWRRALDHVNAASELARQTQYAHARIWVGRAKALVETDLGLADAARASVEEAIAASRETSSGLFELVAVGALGRLELSLGNEKQAASHLRALPEQLRDRGLRDPMLTVWADAIEASIAVGEREHAHAHLEMYETDADRLVCPWAAAAAARCRGLLAGADGDVPGAFASFDRALAELERYPYPLERGRTLLCLGVVRRQAQQKRPAREALEQALAIFDGLGARLWAEKARAELGRISGRRAPSDELTETERRVAELAAGGRTNREIAAELYMGVSTVEAHLSHVYRKLGVRRAELATRLAREVDDDARRQNDAIPMGGAPQT